MFDDILKEMKKIEKSQEISIPIAVDKDGCVDKECPSDNCLYQFKVNEDDWGNLFKDEGVFCPRCGNEAPADKWWTTEQVEEGLRQAAQRIEDQVHNALVKGSRRANSRPQKGFLRMEMSVKGGIKNTALIPIKANEEMIQKISCDKCQARFGVIGIGFFCPCCGHNSAENMFDAAIEKIRVK